MSDLSAAPDRLASESVAGNFPAFVPLGAVLSIVGWALFVVAVLGGNGTRAWQMFHVNWVFWTGVTAASIGITSVHKIVGAKWSGVILRLSQAAAAFIPVSLLGLVLVLTVGYHAIYGDMDVARATLTPGKATWLAHTWIAARLVVGIGGLFLLGYWLIRRDLLPDLDLVKDRVTGARRARYERMLRGYDADRNHTLLYRLAAAYAPVYAGVMTYVGFDTVMELQPHWDSNLFGGWFFMGAWLAALMLQALLVVYALRNTSFGEFISAEQRHDLGKLCFGFTVFWMYLLWAQFLVIWYGNLPAETGFVFARLWGPWLPIGTAVFLAVFVVPFGGLIGVAPKKAPFTLAMFATISFAGLWLERYLIVMPSITQASGPVIGLPELGSTIGFVGLFLLSYGWFARTYPMVSPRLAMIALEREASKHFPSTS